jgi:hypothetical protein
MRVKNLSASGFRGFNDHREIVFDNNLTLVAALVSDHLKTYFSESVPAVSESPFVA